MIAWQKFAVCFTGSCKIEHNCTAVITVTSSKASVSADVVLTHYGHQKQIEHLRLAKPKREEIAVKLKQAVSKGRILDEIRESVTDNFCRHHLTTRKDLGNIERSFGLREVERHTNDQQSVLAWIQEWQESPENPVLHFKLQGQESAEGYDLATDDFFLVIQTPLQRAMFKKFAPNGICCDSTHGTNAYDFVLNTVLVVDEFGSGFPAGWCLSSHEDFTTMCLFFQELKKNCGTVHSSYFMSDMAPQFYNAWVGVMEGPRPAKLVCTWHVDKAWKEELRKKIGDLDIEGHIYKLLRTMLEQTSEVAFQSCLDGIQRKLQSEAKASRFLAYFRKEWIPKQKHWAYCFRKGLGINTNMFVEAFHRVFKRLYLGGKVNKRVDRCLVNLMKYVRDKGFDRLVKLTKGKLSYRARNIQERHQKSQLLSTKLVSATDKENEWIVTSTNAQRNFKVNHLASSCPQIPACQLICKPCNVCVHMFCCSCPDCLITGSICKHIHLVKRHITPEERLTKVQVDPVCLPGEVELVKSCLRGTQVTATDELKTRIESRLLLMKGEVQRSSNIEALRQLEKQLTAAQSLFESLSKQKNPLKTLIAKTTAPANKIQPVQPRFYSTKKRHHPTKVRFARPTRDEQEELMETLQMPEASSIKSTAAALRKGLW